MTILLRKPKGNFLAELPVAIYLFVLVFLMPTISLGTMALRYTFLCIAAHDGARAASVSTPDQAQKSAESAVANVVKSFSGLNNVSTTVTRLTDTADADNKIYSYEVAVSGTLDPLIKIPGVIESFSTKVSSTKIAENTEGL